MKITTNMLVVSQYKDSVDSVPFSWVFGAYFGLANFKLMQGEIAETQVMKKI